MKIRTLSPFLLLLGSALVAACSNSPAQSTGSGASSGSGGSGATGGVATGGSGGSGATGGSTTGGSTTGGSGGSTTMSATPASFKIGAAAVDITPPAQGAGMPPDAFASCDPKYNGPRQFTFQEPYVDAKNSGHFDPGDDYCDANKNGSYDGIFLAGGGGENRVPVKVLDPISARAVSFGTADDKHHVAIVSVDSLGLLAGTIKKIADTAKAKQPALEEVLVSSTHDESAPDPVGLWGPEQTATGVNDYYMDYLVQQAADAAVKAYEAAEAAHLRFVQARQPSSFRPIWSSYPFVHDPSIMAMQAVSAQDATKVIFTLANYNFHAEIYGFSDDAMLSHSLTADWPGVLRKELETKYGGVGIGLSGLIGSVEMPLVYPGGEVPQTPLAKPVNTNNDEAYTIYDAPQNIMPIDHGTAAEADAIGKAVAKSVADAFDKAPDHWSIGGDVRSVVTPVCFTVENQNFILALEFGLIKRDVGCNGSMENTSSSVAVLDVGDGQVAYVPGEVFPFTLQRSFLGSADMPFPDQPMTPWAAAAMTGQWNFFAGLGQDGAGYFMPPADFVGLSNEVVIEPWASWDMKSPEYDSFGWGHGDDGESLGPHAGAVLADGLQAALKQIDPAGPANTTIATGRFIDADGKPSRSPFPSMGFKGAVGVWVLPAGSTDFTPGTGSIYTLKGYEMVGGQKATATIGGFIDVHGLPEDATSYSVATRGVWLPGADANSPNQKIFADTYPGK